MKKFHEPMKVLNESLFYEKKLLFPDFNFTNP